MKYVKCVSYDNTGRIESKTKMEYPEACKVMAAQGQKARKLMNETGVDHVLYGLKIYDTEKMIGMQFYMLPLNENDFRMIAGRIQNSIVCAIHKRTQMSN